MSQHGEIIEYMSRKYCVYGDQKALCTWNGICGNGQRRTRQLVELKDSRCLKREQIEKPEGSIALLFEHRSLFRLRYQKLRHVLQSCQIYHALQPTSQMADVRDHEVLSISCLEASQCPPPPHCAHPSPPTSSIFSSRSRSLRNLTLPPGCYPSH